MHKQKYLDPNIKYRYNPKGKTWQVHTFFHGSKRPEYKWINCSAAMAKWYQLRGYPNVTAPSTAIPWSDRLGSAWPIETAAS